MRKLVQVLLLSSCLIQKANAQIITNGLYAYYPFNGNANDESLNNHHGLTNSALLIPDRFGRVDSAYYLGAMASDIITMNLPAVSIDFSVCFWLRPSTWGTDSVYDAFAPLEWRDSTSHAPLFSTNIFMDKRVRHIYRNGDVNVNTVIMSETETLQRKDDWMHITCVYNAPKIYIYFNGVLRDSSLYNNPTPWQFNKLVLGENYWTNINPQFTTKYQGAIDDIYIFNRGITPGEVWDIYTEQPTSTTSISKVANYDHLISLFPNPAQGSFSLDLSRMPAKNELKINIVDLNGKLIFSEAINQKKYTFIHKELLHNGNYIVNLTGKNDHQIIYSKMIVINK